MRDIRHDAFQAFLSKRVNINLIDDAKATLYDAPMIGTRFRKARLHKGLTLKEVGTVMAVSPQAVGQWEKGQPQFTAAKTNMLANLLEVDFEWLEGDIGTDDEIIFIGSQDGISRSVPIVNKFEAMSFSMYSVSAGVREDFNKGLLVPSAKILGRGFAFEMDDDSMQPMIQRGDILIFDPATKPDNDDIVFSVIYEQGGTYRAVIRLYEILDESNSDFTVISLKALNEFHPSFTLNAGDMGMVFAVLVELRMVRPKGWRSRG